MIVNPGLIRNLGGGGSSKFMVFNSPLMTTVDMARGTGSPTFTRSSSAYIPDFENRVTKVEADSASFPGQRAVTNLLTYSEDFSNGAWLIAGTASKSGSNTILLPATSDYLWRNYAGVAGSLVDVSFVLSGTGTIDFEVQGVTPVSTRTITLTSVPTRYNIQAAISTGSINIFIVKRAWNTATSVTIASAQLENVTGQTNQNPSEYVSTHQYGPEANPDVSFDNSSAWTTSGGTVAVSDGAVRFSSSPSLSYAFAIAPFSFSMGDVFRVDYDIESISGTNARIMFLAGGFGTEIGSIYSAGKGTVYYLVQAIPALYIQTVLFCTGTANAVIRSMSAKKVTSAPVTKWFNTLNPNVVGVDGVVYTGKRVVSNLLTYSEDFSNPSWVKASAGTGVLPSFPSGNNNQPDPLGGNLATRIVCSVTGTPSGVNLSSIYKIIDSSTSITKSNTISLWMRSRNGGTQNASLIINGAYAKVVQVTPTWQRFSSSLLNSTAAAYFQVGCLVGGDSSLDIDIYGAQVENVTSQLNQNPGDYVATTTAAKSAGFDYLNPFTVDGNGVVTDSGVRTPVTFGTTAPVLGSELVVNGTFDTSSGWVLGSDWTINTATGKLIKSGSLNTNSSIPCGLVTGKIYSVSLEYTYASGTYPLVLCGGDGATQQVKNGYNSFILQSGTNNALYILGNGATTAGSIDNISVKEVTGNIGNALYAKGYLSEPSASNLFLQSDTGATQSIVLAAVPHTLSFRGTGSITLSGTATGTLAGTGATNRVSLTFTPAAGSCTFTVAGSCTIVQVETGSVATSYIPTTTASASRAATSLSYPVAGNLPVNDFTIYAEVVFNKLGGVDAWFANDNSSIGIVMYADATNFYAAKRNPAVSSTLVKTRIIGQKYKVIARFSSVTGVHLFLDGVKGSDGVGVLDASYAYSVFRLNEYSGVPLNMSQLNTKIYNRALTDAQCIAMTL